MTADPMLRYRPTIPSAEDRRRYGTYTIDALRSAGGAEVDPTRARWLSDLADALTLSGHTRLADTFAGWGWTTTLTITGNPTDLARRKIGGRNVKNLRERSAELDRLTPSQLRMMRELADGLESAGYRSLDETPAGWSYPVTATRSGG
jgi:hypothetical protein